jgi:hypothetical protein
MIKLYRTVLSGALLTLAACHSWHTHACSPETVYERATSVAPLTIPAGLEPPDTKHALRIPDLNEPAPPPRGPKDACLDEPPSYATSEKSTAPKVTPKPQT